jgi:hypothetical protein
MLHGSIQGSSLDFSFAKISVNTTIKDSKLIALSWCKCDRVITSELKYSIFHYLYMRQSQN